MTQTPSKVVLNERLRITALLTLCILIVHIILWELWLAPIKPNGSWVVLKALPLLLPIRGIWRANLYTMQWASMLILLYVLEGSMRLYSDFTTYSRIMAGIELALALIFFFCAIFYVHPAKKAYKQAQKKSSSLS